MHAFEDPMTVLEPSSSCFSEKQQHDILWTTDISGLVTNTKHTSLWILGEGLGRGRVTETRHSLDTMSGDVL